MSGWVGGFWLSLGNSWGGLERVLVRLFGEGERWLGGVGVLEGRVGVGMFIIYVEVVKGCMRMERMWMFGAWKGY